MSNSVGWFEIHVDDMQRAKAFYEAVFKLKLDHLDGMDNETEMQTFPMQDDQYGAAGALVKSPDTKAGGSHSVMVYFSCDDCAVEADRAARAGGRLIQEKTSIGEYGAFALIMDTEGNHIGLHSMQ